MSMVQILQAQLHEQSKHLMEEQTQELAKLRADQSSANSAEASWGCFLTAESSAIMSFEAARQRVRRMVKLRANVTCVVPRNIVDQWNKQGNAQEQLLRVFMEQGFDKDPTTPSP